MIDSSLNRCKKCGKEIPSKDIAFFALNKTTDRFELLCRDCHGIAPTQSRKPGRDKQTKDLKTARLAV
jgi:hypothetical protein